MHFCTANIAIGDDNNNIMHRGEFAPVSWPEVEILRTIHGPEAVTAVVPFARANQNARDERDRLARIYGEGVCQTLWGGKNPPRELEAPDVKLADGVTWKNPLSDQVETIAREEPTGVAETVGETGEDMTNPPTRERMPGGQFTKKK